MRALVMLAAAVASDPGGWSAAKWGMPPATIPGAVQLSDPLPERNFRAHGVAEYGADLTLGPTAWRAFYLAGPSGLDRVMLRPADRNDATESEFQRVENLLATKYGRPFDRTAGKTRTAVWTFPSTTITLEYTDFRPAIQLRSLYLTYARRSQELDKLD